GGDDLFVLGRWNVVIDLAEAIRRDFRRWACHHADLTLSGGVALVPPKFPIAKAAELAGEAEKLAKEHALPNGREKDSFALLGYALHWDVEFPVVKALKGQLADGLRGGVPRSLLRTVFDFHELRTRQRTRGENETWRWRLAYQLARAQERAKKDAAAVALFEDLKTNVFTNQHGGKPLSGDTHYDFLDLLYVAARWTELELRN
ncbi:MAG: hypothetical protein WBA12_13690, partial [Catalinimonas sp.]